MRIGSIAGKSCILAGFVLMSAGAAKVGVAQTAATTVKGPWMNAGLDPDKRADLMIKEMTLDE